jgi:DNA polymerase-4
VAFLAPLPVERLYGVGARTAAQLRALGLATLAEVARYPERALTARFGSLGAALRALAAGVDPRPVDPDRAAVSVGSEETFEHDLVDGPSLRRHVTEQADRVAARLRASRLQARTVTLKLKDPEFHLHTRRHTLAAPTSDGRVIGACALELLARDPVRPPGVRLSGVSAGGLVPADGPRQLDFEERGRARGERLGRAIDAIHARFGDAALERAESLADYD